MKYYSILAALTLSISSSASELEDNFFSTDFPIVISASRLTQSVLTSPSAVTVVDKAMIEASGFVEIADLLRLVPGFQVAYADGKDIAVTYHGNGWEYPNRLQVLVNGRSTYRSALSSVDWSAIGIHITDIERIEVVRGPAASAYGSNSFTAAINIITTSPRLDDKFTLRARSGGSGEQELLLRYSGFLENMHYRVSASTRENNGFSHVNDGQDLNNISFHSQLELENHDTLDLHLGYTNGSTGADADPILPTRDRDLTAYSAHLKWQHLLSDHEELKLNFYHNYHDEDDEADSIPLSEVFGISPDLFQALTGAPDQSTTLGLRTTRSTKTDLELQYSWFNDSGLQYVIGAGTRYDSLDSDFYTHGKGRVSDTSYRLYGNVQLPIFNTLMINAGTIYESNKISKSHLSPRLSLNWQVSDEQSFRISASRAYRIPSLLEVNLNVQNELSNGLVIDEINNSDKNLKAEEITSYEIGYIGKLSTAPVSWEFKAYKEKIQELTEFVSDKTITDLVDNKVRTLINAGSYRTYGIEGELTYRPKQNHFVKLQFNRGHSVKKTLKAINPNRFSRPTEYMPRESYGILAALPLQSWQFNLGAYRVGSLKWAGTGDEVEAYTRIDISVSKNFKVGTKQNVKLKLAAQNINNKYEEFKKNQFSEPHFYAEISFTDF